MQAEVLAPAGSMEAFEAAAAAHADAVYLGLPSFGARAFAENFTLESLETLIGRAHLYGMKIYVTMNTLMEENQMEEAYEMAKKLHEMNADALIIQDLGFLHLLHERLPELELHASTQISASTPHQIEQLKKLGVKRVVLAREATLEQIEACAKTGMELEVFVHGALCISFSGQCRFSVTRYGRSGNKGACAQPCRMEYSLSEDGKKLELDHSFLLSPKDLSVLQEIPALEKAGVASLKIEGRMKSPEYVYLSTLMARKAREGKKLSRQDQLDLMTAFNRGYTRGHAFEMKGKNLMNPATSNHQGVRIGKVIRVVNGKAQIKLEEDLHQEDGLRFENDHSASGGHANFLYDEKGKLVSQVRAGQIAQVKINGKVFPGAIVKKTSDSLMEKRVHALLEKEHPHRKVDMHISCMKPDSPLFLTVRSGQWEATVTGVMAQQARKRPTTLEDFEKQLSKLGNTWAEAGRITAEIPDNIFVPVSAINELRRNALEVLEAQITRKRNVKELPYTVELEPVKTPESLVEILRKDQLSDISPEVLWDNHMRAVSLFPFKETERKSGLQDDESSFVGAHLGNSEIVDGMNVTNSYALAALLKMGYQGAALSEELSDQGRKDLLAAFQNRYGFAAPVLSTVYEKPRLMVMNHCPINTALKDGRRENCSLCRIHHYELEGKDGRKAILYGNPNCQMALYDEKARNFLSEIPELKKEGIEAFRFVFTDESPKKTKEILDQAISFMEVQNTEEISAREGAV